MSVIAFPDATLGKEYSADLSALIPEYDMFEVTGLPAGLTYVDGVISGTPEEDTDDVSISITARHDAQVSNIDFSTPVDELDEDGATFYRDEFKTTVYMKDSGDVSLTMTEDYGDGEDYLTVCNGESNGEGIFRVALRSDTVDFSTPQVGTLEEEHFPIMLEVKFRYAAPVLPESWPSFMVMPNFTSLGYALRVLDDRSVVIYTFENVGTVPVDLLDGQWHTVACYCAFDQSQRLYVDGVERGVGVLPEATIDFQEVRLDFESAAADDIRMHIKHVGVYTQVTDTQLASIVARQAAELPFVREYTGQLDVKEAESDDEYDIGKKEDDNEDAKKEESVDNRVDKAYKDATIGLGVITGVLMIVVVVMAIMMSKR